MTKNEKECIQHLESGIQHKREGNYNEAIAEYQEAYYLDPFNRNVYVNMAKVLLPTGFHDYAIKNLLTFAHLIIRNDIINMESYDFAVPFYEWSGIVNNNSKIHKNLAIKAVSQDFNLSKVIANINLTFNAGLCYIYRHKDIMGFHSIPGSLVNNYAKTILGQQPDGLTLFDSKFAPMVRTIGLSFLLRNLITDPNLSNSEITQIYFSDTYSLDDF